MEYKDYYKILGVAKDAAKKDIQKTYRKLARKFHPDINKTPEADLRFKEINEAYEVLKDSEKRSKYDQFGSAWKSAQRTGGPPPGFENIRFDFGGGDEFGASGFSSFFESLFGGGGAFGGARGRGRQRPQAGSNLTTQIRLGLQEMARGGKRQVTLRDPDSGRQRTLEVSIPPGIRPGQKIRLGGQGGEGIGGGPRGDLLLEVGVLPHPTLRLEANDLYASIPVTPWEAALGGQAVVETLDGPVTVRIPEGSSSGRKIRLKGKGFPARGGREDHDDHGDLYGEIRIVLPPKLSEGERELFQQLSDVSEYSPRLETVSK